MNWHEMAEDVFAEAKKTAIARDAATFERLMKLLEIACEMELETMDEME